MAILRGKIRFGFTTGDKLPLLYIYIHTHVIIVDKIAPVPVEIGVWKPSANLYAGPS